MPDDPSETPAPPILLGECELPSGAWVAGDEFARLAQTDFSTNDPGIMWATLAVAAELRAIALTLGRLLAVVVNER